MCITHKIVMLIYYNNMHTLERNESQFRDAKSINLHRNIIVFTTSWTMYPYVIYLFKVFIRRCGYFLNSRKQQSTL